MKDRRRLWVFLIAAGAYVLPAALPWNPDEHIRRAAGIVAATLVLWISEVAPLGVVAMAIPIASTLAGLLSWKDAVAAWGDEIIFLFLGAFLLARALDKYGAFEWVIRARWTQGSAGGGGTLLAGGVLAIAGALSTLQNNTAVAAMLLPATVAMARRTRSPGTVALALAWGATFGGMATPVGTAPNFIGYSAMKKLDAGVSFVSWLRVGLPVWIGATAIGWGILTLAARRGRRVDDRSGLAAWLDELVVTDVGPQLDGADFSGPDGVREKLEGRHWAIAAFAVAALLWLATGFVRSATHESDPAAVWVRTYLPESLVPVVLAWILYLVRVGPRGRPVLDRHDFQALDWDTIFLIAGGLSLGRMLDTSGFAAWLARAVQGAELSPVVLVFVLAGSTVMLSELTSNTATASLMVPIAASLAPAVNLPAVQTIWLVCMAASLGFALPVSTPPNAIVYGTRLVPLRLMVVSGVAVDVLVTIWLVLCITWLG